MDKFNLRGREIYYVPLAVKLQRYTAKAGMLGGVKNRDQWCNWSAWGGLLGLGPALKAHAGSSSRHKHSGTHVCALENDGWASTCELKSVICFAWRTTVTWAKPPPRQKSRVAVKSRKTNSHCGGPSVLSPGDYYKFHFHCISSWNSRAIWEDGWDARGGFKNEILDSLIQHAWALGKLIEV